LSIAVDFTMSNGEPRLRESLHNYDENHNEYLSAISSVGSILQYYDSDKKIPTFGFGAILPPNVHTSHCFALNGDILNPEADGLEEVIKVYKNALTKIKLHGPTFFAPVIEFLCDMAQADHSCT
jgi:hypothetical protein